MRTTFVVLFVLFTVFRNRAIRLLLLAWIIWSTQIASTLFFAFRHCIVLWKAWRVVLFTVTATARRDDDKYIWSLFLDPWISYMRVCLIILMFASVLSMSSPESRVEHRPQIHHLLREPGLQRIRTIWLYNVLRSARRALWASRKFTWRTIKTILLGGACLSFDYFCDGGWLTGLALLFFPFPLFLNVMLSLDCMSLLQVQLSSSWGSQLDVELVLRRFRHHLWFAVTPNMHLMLLGLAIIAGFNRLVALLFLVYPITLHAALLLFLAIGGAETYLGPSDPMPKPTSSTSFCSVCHKTGLLLAKGEDGKGRHHQTVKSLKKSAMEGCRICRAVWQHRKHVPVDFLGLIMFWKPTTSFSTNSLRIEIVSEACRDKLRNTCQFRAMRKEDLQASLGFPTMFIDYRPRQEVLARMFTDSTVVLNRIGIVTEPISFIGPLLQARRWLEDCRSNHDDCSRNSKQRKPFTPTRLIHIPDDYMDLGVWLLPTTNEQAWGNISYTTLSHCWGGTTPIKLTKACQREYEERGIPYDDLPKTFQHAVVMTKFLGIDFLWIDSLCIIQDCSLDWRREARNMCDVYTHTICNIAASDARSSTEGCFFQQDSRIMRIERVDNSTYLANETDLFPHHPLYERAWVFQESFLAPRAIDCGRAQLFWKCAQLRASEVFPSGVNEEVCPEYHPAMRFDDYSFRKHPVLDANHIRNQYSDTQVASREPSSRGFDDWSSFDRKLTDDPFEVWDRLVVLYTNTSLTQSQDRVIAFSGLVKALEPQYGDYLCGLWKMYMPFELLWISTVRSRTCHRMRAPSWSWLSIEGLVSYRYTRFLLHKDTLMAQFQSHSVRESSHSSGVLVYQGGIHLKAPVLLATWSGSWQEEKNLRIETVNGRTLRSHIGSLPLFSLGYGDIFFDDIRDVEPPLELYLIPIIKKPDKWSKSIVGLVVQPSNTGEPHRYQRLGMFVDHHWDTEILFDEAVQEELVLI